MTFWKNSIIVNYMTERLNLLTTHDEVKIMSKYIIPTEPFAIFKITSIAPVDGNGDTQVVLDNGQTAILTPSQTAGLPITIDFYVGEFSGTNIVLTPQVVNTIFVKVITFSEAIIAIKAGKTVKRLGNDRTLILNDLRDDFSFLLGEILAEDWQIVG